MKKVTVKVPATTANLGPGFDALGCALTMYNTLSFEESGDGLLVTGCEEKYAGYDNLAAKAYRKTLERLSVPLPKGLKIHISGDIPISRGLGSSSSLIVSGVMAANRIHGGGLSDSDILDICCDIEGHPDNVAPAIFGGVTAAMCRGGKTVSVRYDISENLRFTALIPDFEMSTDKARSILPKTIDRLDGVYNIGCLAVLLKALETGDENILSYALDDRLHQPYRATMIPDYDKIRETALSLGCCGFVISGSGSTLLAVGGYSSFPSRMADELKGFKNNWQVYPLSVDKRGAVLTEEDV